MKLASYNVDGQAMFGAVLDGGVMHLSGRLTSEPLTLREALAADRMEEMRGLVATGMPDVGFERIHFLPTIPDPANFFAAGVNYRDHVEETGRKVRTDEDGPSIFIRLASSLVGHNEPIVRPKASSHFDFEGELAVIIGRGGRHIAQEKALDHVAGYSCFMDGSLRDYQKHSTAAGKNFVATGPLGPWMVDADLIADPPRLMLTTRLNGNVVQHCGIDRLIFDIPYLISYLSRITPLEPGDVIATGTPSGVGRARTPPLWMQPGDHIEVEVSDIGVLANPVIAEV